VAIKDSRIANTLVGAVTGERVDAVRITRILIGVASKQSLAIDPGGASARLHLPAPFADSATFTAPHSWEGTLTGSFAGAPDVPLAGPSFSARLNTR
jgi:hypothetical protein